MHVQRLPLECRILAATIIGCLSILVDVNEAHPPKVHVVDLVSRITGHG